MRHLAFAIATLIAALLIAFLASQPPAPRPIHAPPERFSAERAMRDVGAISRAPRPTGTAENERARTYLLARMRELGLVVGTQRAPLPEKSIERLRLFGVAEPGDALVNLIGVLRGRDPAKPAILLMAHHDSVGGSPGAADDAAGVAAALEIVRALRVRGTPARDVIVLFTDAEELGLDGAELFFGGHPLASRTGMVINMEARGGGGRASMFETSTDNGQMIELYRRSVERPAANSMAVLVYERMPNNTDLTIAKRQGIAGFNIAFIGRSALYHSPMATPERLDRGALQDIGAQALGLAGAMAFAEELPARAEDAAFGDVLSLFVIAYPPLFGWVILGAAALLFAFAWTRARSQSLSFGRVAGGAGLAFALVLHAMLLLRVGNLISGSGGPVNYYDRLAALPRLEVQAFLLCLAAILLASAAGAPTRRLVRAAPAVALTLAGILAGGWSPYLLGIGFAAVLTALVVRPDGASPWSGWFGSALVVLLLALVVQIAAPTASPLLAWPLIVTAAAAAAAAFIDPELRHRGALAVIAVLGAFGAAQLLYLAHLTFLGIGTGLPDVMALFALLIAMLVWPLFRCAARPRLFTIAAAVLLVAGAGLALSVRLDPIAPTVPPYSDKS